MTQVNADVPLEPVPVEGEVAETRVALYPWERLMAASPSGMPEELQDERRTHAVTSIVTPPKAHSGTWIRNALGVQTFQGLSRNGPSWPQVIRRVTRDFQSRQILESLDWDNLPKLVLHKSCLPGCSWDCHQRH